MVWVAVEGVRGTEIGIEFVVAIVGSVAVVATPLAAGRTRPAWPPVDRYRRTGTPDYRWAGKRSMRRCIEVGRTRCIVAARDWGTRCIGLVGGIECTEFEQGLRRLIRLRGL